MAAPVQQYVAIVDGSGNINPVNANGQATSANSQPVVIASDQTPVAIATNIVTIKTSVTRPADTNAYAIGDCFSDSTSAPTAGGFTLTAAARASGGTGKITDAVISMSAKSAFQGELWIFDQATTNTNDNAAIALSAANALNLIGAIPFNVNDTGSVAGFSYITGLDIRFTCVGSANLRFLVVVKAAFTPASAEVLGIALKVEN
jgi:hypothetical protein